MTSTSGCHAPRRTRAPDGALDQRVDATVRARALTLAAVAVCLVAHGLGAARPARAQTPPGLTEAPTLDGVALAHEPAAREPVALPRRPPSTELLRDLRLLDGPLREGARAGRNVVLDLAVGRVLGQALLGDLIGAALGATVAGILAAAIGCQNGESQWLRGFGCASGVGYAVAMGALFGAALGGPIAIARADGAWRANGNPWHALGGAAIGLTAGGVLTAVLVSEWTEPTLSTILGGAVGLLTATIAEIVLYEGSRPHGTARRAAGAGAGPVRAGATAGPNMLGLSLRGGF